MLIADHVYYVTGGASGLGLACVNQLLQVRTSLNSRIQSPAIFPLADDESAGLTPALQLGAYVAILDLNVEAGERIAAAAGPKAIFVECNVTSEEEMDAAIIAATTAFGDKVTGGVVHAGGK